MFEGFDEFELEVNGTVIFARQAGQGEPLVLLHGFPETSAMWRDIAPRLAEKFSVVCLDLRGYGRSGCPRSSDDHVPYSKRTMATDVVKAMEALGHPHFAVAGHDRGGRVAYRIALDHPDCVDHLIGFDVVSAEQAWRHADSRLAVGFWPWSLLAQNAPLPERLVGASPDAVIDNALSPDWGTPAEVFPDAVRGEYLAQLQGEAHLHAICEEYRAGAGLDREHDRADLSARRTIACPALVLWSAAGPLGTWYDHLGGPLALWSELAPHLSGEGVAGGHFFPEEYPSQTAAAIAKFIRDEKCPCEGLA